MKALCIGQSTYDIASFLDDFPEENKNYDIIEKLESGGGVASNIACTLGKWGVETYLSTAVGSDSNGEKIKKEFEMHGVKPDFIESNYDKDTSLAFIVINKKTGTRTSLNLTSIDKMAHVKKTELEIEPDIILMDGYEYQASTRAINRFPKVTTIMDASKPVSEVIELSKYCKYIIATQDFAESVTKIKMNINDAQSLLNGYNHLKARYPRNEIIITLGKSGVIYANNNQIKVMPSIKQEIKDTTGSTDVFHGVFAYGILNNLDFEKTITYAVIASGLSSANYGGRTSIPPLNNVINYYNQKFGNTANVTQQG